MTGARGNIDKLKIKAPTRRSARKWERGPKIAVAAGVLLLLVAASSFLWFCSSGATYKTEKVGYYNPTRDISVLAASGYVVAQRKAAVASRITGRVKEVFVEEGAFVQAGQILAVLDDDEARASYEQAQSNLQALEAQSERARVAMKNALTDYERGRTLVAEGHISRTQYDTLEANFLSSYHAYNASIASSSAGRASLALAKVGWDNTRITAPFDAVVLTKNADVGDVVTPLGASANARSSVFTIADLGSLQVETDVSEASISKIFRGQHCEIQVDAIPGERFAGHVAAVVPTVERAKATVSVKVKLARLDKRLLQDMSVKVSFLSRRPTAKEQKPVLALSNASLLVADGAGWVFVVGKDLRVKKTRVTTGERWGSMMEVLSGVRHGDEVVLNPLPTLSDDKRITVAGE